MRCTPLLTSAAGGGRLGLVARSRRRQRPYQSHIFRGLRDAEHRAGSARVARGGMEVGRLGASGAASSRSAGTPGGPAHGSQPALAGSTLLAKLEAGGVRRGRGLAVMPVLWPGASAAAPVFLLSPIFRSATSHAPLMARGFVSVDWGVYWLGAGGAYWPRGAS